MHERSIQQARRQEQAFRQYVQHAAGSGGSTVDGLGRLAQLRDQGALTEEEFQREKAKLLG